MAMAFFASCLARDAAAQVTVEVVVDHDHFLASEPMLVGVRVTNFSGQTLKLGADPTWLQITVEGDRGFVVEKSGDPPVVEPFEVPSSSKGTRWLDLQPYFNMNQPGSYKITAVVRIPELATELTSKAKQVLITSGAKVWEQEFGLLINATDQHQRREVRRYALVQSMDQKQTRLYVRVSDRLDTKAYRVFSIGRLLAFSTPEAQVDRNALLHVLFQSGPRTFTYVQVDPDGKLVSRQTHSYTGGRPQLRAKEDGQIRVSGGMRVKSSSDIPQPVATDDATGFTLPAK